jgi:cysteine-rich repeat protein
MYPKTCGNALLNNGEECDDGNENDGDGCNAECKIETNEYWDCDLIGEPCLPLCGWKTFSREVTEDWGLSLSGFVLPACEGGLCLCTSNLSYYDVKKLPVGSRRLHMMQHFVSCSCDGIEERQLDYFECTPENRGCRLCSKGFYHDDLLRRCIECGSACAIGFKKDTDNVTECHYEMSSVRRNRGWEDVIDKESEKGCIPCERYYEKNIRFLPHSVTQKYCGFECYKDYTESTEQEEDYYCSTEIKNMTGECNGICLSCREKKNELISHLTHTALIGKYMKGCFADRGGYTWESCDASQKPLNSVFIRTSYSEKSEICKWECIENYHFDVMQGKCVGCFDPLLYKEKYPCQNGEHSIECGNSNGKRVCIQCQGTTPYPYQVWSSSGPWYTRCIPECERGISWNPNLEINELSTGFSDEGHGPCVLCSQVSCLLGEFYIPCSLTNDTQCVPCETSLGLNQEYYLEGSCNQRCVEGFFWDSRANECKSCQDIECGVGHRKNSNCILPEERLFEPVCDPCSEVLSSREQWYPNSEKCEKLCTFNFVRNPLNGTCEEYEEKLCDFGYQSSKAVKYLDSTFVITELVCTLCDSISPLYFAENNPTKGIAWEFGKRGNCEIKCKEGYEKNGSNICVVRNVISNTPINKVDVVTEKMILALNPYYNKTFPKRKIKHT